MDTVKFLKEYGRMCKSYGNYCRECEMRKVKDNVYESCSNAISRKPEEAISIVEKWSAEHPVKTRQSEFLKIFPNTKIEGDTLAAHPCYIESEIKRLCRKYDTCDKCKKEFWLAEVE